MRGLCLLAVEGRTGELRASWSLVVQPEPLRCLWQEWPCCPWDRQCPECALASWAPPGVAPRLLSPCCSHSGGVQESRAGLPHPRCAPRCALGSSAAGPCSAGSSAAGGEEWAALGAVGVIPTSAAPSCKKEDFFPLQEGIACLAGWQLWSKADCCDLSLAGDAPQALGSLLEGPGELQPLPTAGVRSGPASGAGLPRGSGRQG